LNGGAGDVIFFEFRTLDKKDNHAVNVSGDWRIFFEFYDGNIYVLYYALRGDTMKQMARQPTPPGIIIKEDYLNLLSITPGAQMITRFPYLP